jgi:uncharacterized protein GlcG (DUF336 family)
MNTFTVMELTAEAALNMYSAAVNRAKEIGFSIAVTIVDRGGNTKFFARMDGAPLMACDISRKKAVTAVGFGMETGKAWHDFIKDDPILNQGVTGIEDFILFGGGKPIYIDGTLVGAIGVSGGHYTQDEQCCEAAMKVIG